MPRSKSFHMRNIADDDGFGKPVLTVALQGQMETAIASNIDQTNVRLRLSF